MSHTYRLAQLVFPFTHFVLGGSFISIKKKTKGCQMESTYTTMANLMTSLLAMCLTIKHLLKPKLMEMGQQEDILC